MFKKLKPLKAPDDEALTVMFGMVMRSHGLVLESMNEPKKNGAKTVSCVMSIVKDVFGSPERYDSMEEQATDLAVRIAREKPFDKGNNQTAVLTTITMLDAYGRPVACSQDTLMKAMDAAENGDGAQVSDLLCSFH